MNAENRRADSFHVTISNELLSLRIIIVSRTRARTVENLESLMRSVKIRSFENRVE